MSGRCENGSPCRAFNAVETPPDREDLSTGIRLVEVYDSEGKALALLPRTHFKVVKKDGHLRVMEGQKCLEISFTSPDGKETCAYMPRTLVREYGLNGFRLGFPFPSGFASQELTGIAYGGDKLPYFTSVDSNEKNQTLATLGEEIIPFPKRFIDGSVVRRCKKCNGKRSLHRVYETKEVKQKVLELHKLCLAKPPGILNPLALADFSSTGPIARFASEPPGP